MTFSNDPIRLQPRMLPRRWGRNSAIAWLTHAMRPPGSVGEIWLAHPHNTTCAGRHLGPLLAEKTSQMLGELGRAPPSLRLVMTGEPSDLVPSDGPVALWRMLECPLDSVVNIYDGGAPEGEGARPRGIRCRRGDLIRLTHASGVVFAGGVTALEARANFLPGNEPPADRWRQLASSCDKHRRTTWLRDPAMSVEAWTLPDLSYLEPDGETCHVLMALTAGVCIDGEPLDRGEAVFLPAEGRRVMLTGCGAELVVCYPDPAPTRIWKEPHRPKPAAVTLDPALLADVSLRAAASTAAQQLRAVA